MEQKTTDFTPIKLPEIKSVIRRKGYFICEITDARYLAGGKGKFLEVGFAVAVGKYKGFELKTRFYDSFKSMLRLSHLCNSVGISGELKSLDLLVGRKAKLRVVPGRYTRLDETCRNYRITRFHPVHCDSNNRSKSQLR